MTLAVGMGKVVNWETQEAKGTTITLHTRCHNKEEIDLQSIK